MVLGTYACSQRFNIPTNYTLSYACQERGHNSSFRTSFSITSWGSIMCCLHPPMVEQSSSTC